MGFLDRLFGADEPEQRPAPASRRRRLTEDERAVERYRYLLRTAPPETIEQVHAEAFSKLTDEQRAMIYTELSHGAGTGERPLSSEPETLARSATRAEMRRPGSLERTLQGSNDGPGFGSIMAGSLLGTVAGFVIGSALVSAFLPWDAAYDQGGEASGADQGADAEEAASVDADASGFGDFGGDFGF